MTATEFAEACAGGRQLPDNAVMITFDDGRTEDADPLLDQADMTATMFVISGAADTPSLFYAGWSALEDYHMSGRWDLQAHTDALHDTIPVDPNDEVQQRPLLVNRLEGEGLADWRARITADLDASSDKLHEHTGSRPVAFAYPFGAYGGDDRTNDARLESQLRTIMADHVQMAFHQDEQNTVDLADCDDDPLMMRRLDVGPWSGRQLIARIAAMARLQQGSEAIVEGARDPAPPLPGDPAAAAARPPAQPSDDGAQPDAASAGPTPAPPQIPVPLPVPLPALPAPPVPAIAPAVPPLPAPAPVVTPPPLPPPPPPPPVPAPSSPPPEPVDEGGHPRGRTPPGQAKK